MSTNGSVNGNTIVEQKKKFPKYDGANNDLRVQTWLKLYDRYTATKPEAEKISELLFHLNGRALEWFGDEIADQTYSWQEIKTRMTERFGFTSATPLIDAQNRRLLRTEKVEDYYREKMRFLRQTNLSELEQTQQLTNGLPRHWQLSVISSRPETPTQWVVIAQQCEQFFAQYPRPTQSIPSGNTKPHRMESRTLAADTRNRFNRSGNTYGSPPPCRYCQRLNIDINHWHRECPNNPKSKAVPLSATDPKVSTLSAMETDSAEESEN